MNAAAAKTTSNPVRHEIEPSTTRFAALGAPVAASWVSGDMGDPRVPGPSLYWIDSVVELKPDTATDLRAKYQPVPTTEAPDVWRTLTEAVPQGGFLAGDQLNAAFTATSFKSKVYLAEDTPVIDIGNVGE